MSSDGDEGKATPTDGGDGGDMDVDLMIDEGENEQRTEDEQSGSNPSSGDTEKARPAGDFDVSIDLQLSAMEQSILAKADHLKELHDQHAAAQRESVAIRMDIERLQEESHQLSAERQRHMMAMAKLQHARDESAKEVRKQADLIAKEIESGRETFRRQLRNHVMEVGRQWLHLLDQTSLPRMFVPLDQLSLVTVGVENGMMILRRYDENQGSDGNAVILWELVLGPLETLVDHGFQMPQLRENLAQGFEEWALTQRTTTRPRVFEDRPAEELPHPPMARPSASPISPPVAPAVRHPAVQGVSLFTGTTRSTLDSQGDRDVRRPRRPASPVRSSAASQAKVPRSDRHAFRAVRSPEDEELVGVLAYLEENASRVPTTEKKRDRPPSRAQEGTRRDSRRSENSSRPSRTEPEPKNFGLFANEPDVYTTFLERRMVILAPPLNRATGQSPDELLFLLRSQMAAAIGLASFPGGALRAPGKGCTKFDFADSYDNHRRVQVMEKGVRGIKRVVLLITTSHGAHFRLAEQGHACFMKMNCDEVGSPRFGQIDLTHLVENDTVVYQVAISGWCILFGPFALDADEVYRLVTEKIFELPPGFKFCAVGIQVGTNDMMQLKYGGTGFPEFDTEFRSQVEGEAIRLGQMLSEYVVLLGWGSSSATMPEPDVFERRLRLPRGGAECKVLHQFNHRMFLLDLLSSKEENTTLESGGSLTVVHSVPPWYPPEMLVDKYDRLGHVRPRWYAEAGRDLWNAMLFGIWKLDPTFQGRLNLCAGRLRTFRGNLVSFTPSIRPLNDHYHRDQSSRCTDSVRTLPARNTLNRRVLPIAWWSPFELLMRGEADVIAFYTN